MNPKEILLKQWLFLYSLAVETAAGVYLAIFLIVYNKLNFQSSALLLHKYYASFIVLAGILTLIMAPLFIFYLLIKSQTGLPLWYVRLKKNALYLLIFTLLLYVLYLLHLQNIHVRIVELILAFGIMYIVYAFQNVLLLHGYPAWQNITTSLNILFGVGKAMIITWVVIYHVYDLQGWISIFLIIELVVLFWRLKLLNMQRPETKQSVRFLLVQHSLLFGSRLIIGLFIPLVFDLYQWFIHGQATGVEMMFILFGELLERFLFTFSAIPEYYEYRERE